MSPQVLSGLKPLDKALGRPATSITYHSWKKSSWKHKRDFTESSDSEYSNSDASIDENVSAAGSRATNRVSHYHKWPKLTPFGGKERWKVWYKRFKVCTKGWSSEDKLDEMLPLLWEYYMTNEGWMYTNGCNFFCVTALLLKYDATDFSKWPVAKG